MTVVDRVIRWSTALAVVGVAAVAAVASYEHAYALVEAHGEAGWAGRLVPLTVDGLVYASSMVMLGHGPVGAAVAAWSAVALVGSHELLMMVIHSSQAAPDGVLGKAEAPDPLQEQAAAVFASLLTADRVPSVRAIRAQFHVGQPRAQRLRDHLAAGVTRTERLAA